MKNNMLIMLGIGSIATIALAVSKKAASAEDGSKANIPIPVPEPLETDKPIPSVRMGETVYSVNERIDDNQSAHGWSLSGKQLPFILSEQKRSKNVENNMTAEEAFNKYGPPEYYDSAYDHWVWPSLFSVMFQQPGRFRATWGPLGKRYI